MKEQILNRARLGIVNRQYIMGTETRYYILTIKIDSHHYYVIVLDSGAEIAQTEVQGKLEAAKKQGVRLLFQENPTVSTTSVTLVHYKDDRPNGRPWQKDSELVLKQLMALESSQSTGQFNQAFMDESLACFHQFRLQNEQKYLVQERNPKTTFISAIGPILRGIKQDATKAINQLVGIISGEDKEHNIRPFLQKILGGYIWLDDFLVFLRYASSEKVSDFLLQLFEHGITKDVRLLLEDQYTLLFQAGKFAASKKKVETPNQLLALLLAAYSPEDYVLYKPNDYGVYVDRLGLTAPNNVVERYTLYNEVTHMILARAKKLGYNVQDLIDAYHVVYLLERYEEDRGGHQVVMKTKQPVNKILYGPPGTGKTYHVIYEALTILDPDLDNNLITDPSRRDEAVNLFNQYVESNQVTFCTFHQSFSYEEFVEGIRFNKEKNRYDVQDGVFKRLCNAARAATSDRKQTYNFDPENTRVFKMSLGNTATDDDEVYDYCISNNVIALGWGEHVDFTSCGNKQEIRRLYEAELPNENPYGVEFVERFKHWMRPGDIVVVSYGNKKARAIGKITGDYSYVADSPIAYHQFREVQWLFEDNEVLLPVQSILRDKVFSQQTVYMFNSQDLNMESIQNIISGDQAHQGKNQNYVLIIDEINRGNVSKIFGELITLIEADKRMGQNNELSITLPYSEERLRVPSNVHLLGTMNTADRSIALIDTALRRRFEFVEMLPDYAVLPTDVEGINIRLLLRTINDRIEYLYDRDHVIGHSYLIMDNPSILKYIYVIQNKVIPLLQEYFYEDWEQIELILGGAGKVGDSTYFLNREELLAPRIFKGRIGALEPNKSRYLVHYNPTKAALKRIYETATDSNGQDDLE
ncbi:AAA family ATPase [Paenibacillus aurantius]|uniref:AAA family ATPase n=1 Tax=Paenibacillus aurantius TaxID=2918900 RepID=A0AA96LFG6_9BACL|nr:AAA family ATPase [Paenibacillus aurantius]WNQ12214.1 AAA family ATPase [Paenibacillus aurantius]